MLQVTTSNPVQFSIVREEGVDDESATGPRTAKLFKATTDCVVKRDGNILSVRIDNGKTRQYTVSSEVAMWAPLIAKKLGEGLERQRAPANTWTYTRKDWSSFI